jgi:Response receiver domain
MNAHSYNDLITKTFRDDAIRSVMMIDDDFLPYDELVKSGTLLEGAKKFATEKAADIHKFFQGKRIICDIDKGTDHIDVEKVRKCDLVILDYHLENGDPKKSIQLIKRLSETPHMNLVVVYTSESLERVWLQISASLVGDASADKVLAEEPKTLEFWSETSDMNEVPSEWFDKISFEDLEQYINEGSCTPTTVAWFGANLRSNKSIYKVVCERELNKHNLIKSPKSAVKFTGRNGLEQKWLQFGNVFVTLQAKSKSAETNEPIQIWNSISNALLEWQPPYYRLLISEIQNRLENDPLPFAEKYVHDLEVQAGWLYQILSETDQAKTDVVVTQLFTRLTDEFKKALFDSAQLKEMAKQTIASIKQSFDKNSEEILSYSSQHVGLTPAINRTDIGHALNLALCSTAFEGDHITSGTVLLDESDSDIAYLCVAPACETVPRQGTGRLAKRLTPHRLMKVFALINTDVDSALDEALLSNHIFVKDLAGVRKAFSITNKATGLPIVDYILIHNHDTSTTEIIKGLTVSFLDTAPDSALKPSNKKLMPVAQLRDMYTARFQSMASHHMGRIGVDFIKLS